MAEPSRFPGFSDLGQADDADSLIELLATRRRDLDLSQTEVAARMGTSQSAVARLESGGDLRLSTLERYAKALGTDLGFALRDNGKNDPG